MLNRTSAPAPRHAGRHRAPPRRRRLAVTAPGLALITIATLAALAGCSSGASSSSALASGASSGHGGSIAAAPAASASAADSAAAASAPESGAAYAASGTTSGVAKSGYAGGGAAQDSSARSISGDQQLIYTAQLAVRAKNVGAALSTATSIVTAAGGYVSAENTSGTGSGTGSGSAASKATANVTLKIPAAVYPATLAKLTGAGLGTQLSLQQQAQDVTQQVADVGSRVASDEAAIAQLRTLLKHAGDVSSLLTVQNQIDSQESDLESMLAQQSALNHETAYATVTLTLTAPPVPLTTPARPVPAIPPVLCAKMPGELTMVVLMAPEFQWR